MNHLKKFNEEIGPNTSGGLRLFVFNPNDYGEMWYVMSKSKEDAHTSLLKHLENETKGTFGDQYSEILKQWSEIDVNDPGSFPQKYTLDEHGEGDVVQGEIS